MKNRLIYILTVIFLAVILFTGCKSEDQEAYFIPTPAPDLIEEDEDLPEDSADNTDKTGENGEQAGDSENLEDEPVVVGETITKYVKLNTYGAILNVRSSPTTEENNVVGFLVHTEPVEVISIENGWASILYKDKVCYVSADYLVDFVPPYISPPTPSN